MFAKHGMILMEGRLNSTGEKVFVSQMMQKLLSIMARSVQKRGNHFAKSES